MDKMTVKGNIGDVFIWKNWSNPSKDALKQTHNFLVGVSSNKLTGIVNGDSKPAGENVDLDGVFFVGVSSNKLTGIVNGDSEPAGENVDIDVFFVGDQDCRGSM